MSGLQNPRSIGLGNQVADANGAVTFTWQIPEDTALGEHRLTLTSDAGSVDATFTVVDTRLATTGSNLGGVPIALGVVLLGVGALAVLYSMHRRRDV